MPGPDVQVNIRMIPPKEIERGVLDGQLHVGVAPVGRTLPGLCGLPLYDEQLHLYCAAEHPFFALPDSDLSDAVIAQADAVAPSSQMAKQQAPLRITATATDREGVAFLILTGCYIGFLPTHYARQWEERGMVRAIDPERYSEQVEYQAITLKSGHPNPVLASFMEILQETRA